jgi:hypothetical protein
MSQAQVAEPQNPLGGATRRNFLRGAAGAAGVALGSGIATSAFAEEKASPEAKDEGSRLLSYVWCIDIRAEKREQFRHKFSDLSRFNMGLPAGCKFEAVYETVIGKRDEPPFQIWFRVPNLATFEAAATADAVRKFHDELKEYVDPSFRPCNFILKQIAG